MVLVGLNSLRAKHATSHIASLPYAENFWQISDWTKHGHHDVSIYVALVHVWFDPSPDNHSSLCIFNFFHGNSYLMIGFINKPMMEV